MLVPISWLKEYVDTKLKLKELMWKMTEVGMTTESYKRVGKDIILDVEVTPNRPDWLSIVGIAREVAAIENKKIHLPNFPNIPKITANLPIQIKLSTKQSGRYTAITIANVKVKPSPAWLKDKLVLMGLRPINNLVDITNYVMLELGVPIHVFDYDKLSTKKLSMDLSKGGEKFKSVDNIEYILPKGALIIKEKSRVIDLCGIKGGENTGITSSTKNIFIHLPIYTPILIRKASQALKLASDASYIYERGANAGGTMDSLKRIVDIILKLAGGNVASKVIDIKDKSFSPKKLSLNLEKLKGVLGIEIPKKEVVSLLARLNLSPKQTGNKIVCTIPTYRGDLLIEEDLIEEVARLYGYNKFPKTLPVSDIPTADVPYSYDRGFELEIKNLLVASGFSEISTLSLISKEIIKNSQLNLETHIKLANPVSLEYEYMRQSLIPGLLTAIKLNQNEEKLNFFEYSKTYSGKAGNTKEPYKVAGATTTSFGNIKGTLDLLFSRLNIEFPNIKHTVFSKGMWHPSKSGVIEKGKRQIGTFGEIHPEVRKNFEIEKGVFAFELDIRMLKNHSKEKVFNPIPPIPPQIEDITLGLPKQILIGEVIQTINKQNHVSKIVLTGTYKDTYTFKVWYQHPTKTLTNSEVEKIRNKLLLRVKKKHGATTKE